MSPVSDAVGVPFDGQDGGEGGADQGSRDAEQNRWEPGPCTPHLCGREAACKPGSKPGSGRLVHMCICPHNGAVPDPDGLCPNRSRVPTVASSPILIFPPGHVPDGGASGASPGAAGLGGLVGPAADAAATLPPHRIGHRDPADGPLKSRGPGAPHWTVGVGIFGAALLLTFFVVALVRRRFLRRRKCQTPRSLSKGPLGSELFLPNPQYAVGLGQGLGLHGVPLGEALGEALSAANPNAQPVTLISHRAITLQESIGEGCFGKVYRGELRVPDGGLQTVAVKVLKESASREAEEDFMREVEVMSAFHHPHILRLVGVVPREPQSAPCMVFEFMPFGDLTEVLRCSGKTPWASPRPGLPPLTPRAMLSVGLQIAQGMRYLAAQRFVHRDLACRNCLVGRNLTVKIADFGMSRDVYTCDYYKMGGSRALPVRWMSPEALLYGRFTLESDVWSYGVVLWEVFTRGKLPYYGHANDEALKLVLQGVLLQPPDSADCPPAVVDLMRCCWKTEPRDRLRFPEICARLEEAFKGLSLDVDLPRPPAFPELSLPALPDELDLGYPGYTEPSEVDLEELAPLRASAELLDPENYLLPRAPDPSRVYIEPIAD